MLSFLPVSSYMLLVLGALAGALPAGPDDCGGDHSRNKCTVGQAVQTSSGRVQGHAASIAGEVSEYLGIPYANPPVGELRFQTPTPFKNRGQTIQAAHFGSSCMGRSLLPGSVLEQGPVQDLGLTDAAFRVWHTLGPSQTMSEDCLTLNIWTKPQTGESKKAVLAWVHGGGYVDGASSVPWYNGQFIADEEDVVVVSMNYRLSIFGFPGNPTSTANLGLLDQRLAVEWIWNNIENFGGDPDRITLFGQSAGGGSIDYYSYAWIDNPIVKGLVLQSGTTAVLPRPTKAEASAYWFNTTAAVGCGNSSSDHKQVFECIQHKPAADILSALPLVDVAANVWPYSPTVDEALVFSSYNERKAANLPILVGNTDFEAGIYRLFTPKAPGSQLHILNQRNFVCPAAERAASGLLQGAPTWRYRYFAEFPELRLTTNPPSGAWHTSEVPVLFGTTFATTVPTCTTPEIFTIGKYMRGAWAAFAKDPVNGLTEYEDGWPRYNPSGRTLIRIGLNNTVGSNLGVGNQYDADCP